MNRITAILSLATALFLISASAFAADPREDEFDRFDGTGKSRKKVNVIEWEGNLEIHVYPKGSLAGLALKIDDKDGKKVMVIGYRFDTNPKEQHVRRAILGIPMREPLNVYRDPSTDEYDKVIITNNVLADGVVKFDVDKNLKALYPDGHPALAKGDKDKPSGRSPASAGGTISEEDFRRTGPSDGYVDDAGTIRPYTW